ncbi:MAG: RNA polymerase sigma factor [Polyangiales bacterium]
MKISPEGVERALGGDLSAVRAFVAAMSPIVQARVARALVRHRDRASARDVRQEIADFAQEIFLALFENEGRLLRMWDPARGLSLENFVGLIAERESSAILKSGRRSPWKEDPLAGDDLELAVEPAPAVDTHVASRDFLTRLLEEMRAQVSPKGLRIFELLYVDERSVEEVCSELAMQPDAVYAWRSRLGKLARKLAAELDPRSSRRLAAQKETSP